MHLYIHIPFCHRICPYCAFFKHTPSSTDMKGFITALVKEARLRLPEGYAPRTLYFGGGTPSMLSPTHLQKMVDGLREHIDLSRLEEWSFESNPATFTTAKAQHWKELGINRVSLGAQSFEPELLQLLGREHSPEQIAASVQMLRDAGIPQVNIDLMFSLPGQTTAHWEHTLRSALNLQPEHISTYNLTYEEGTDFYKRYGADATEEETDVAMFNMTDDLLRAAGYRHYEISNFALPGKESLHNLACWRGMDYYGLGPGACGTVQSRRYRNTEDTTDYIRNLLDGHLPPEDAEILTPEQRRTEQLGLMLRTDEGLPPHLLLPRNEETITMLENEGLALRRADGTLHLTRAGRLLADEIALALI